MNKKPAPVDQTTDGQWLVVDVTADSRPTVAVHDAVVSLGRALLQSDSASLAAALDGVRQALGARSLVIEHLDEAGAPFRLETGDPDQGGEETAVAIAVDDIWVGSVGVVFENEPTALDQWALTATADLCEGWIRRSRATAELTRSVEETNRFVATVGHEIRTPLAAVIGLVEELRDRYDTIAASEVRELIGLVADQSREIADIVEDLLVFVRTEHSGFVVRTQPTRLDHLVAAAVASVPVAARSGLTLRRIEAVSAECDPLRTRQIVRNLLVNAHRHGGSDVFVDVRSLPEDKVVVTVADSGGPIPDEIRATMFDPYATANRSDGALASLGLGLTVSRQLAQQMGGELSYRWEGESRFEMQLPRSERSASV